jgi:hypothetical protein
MLEVFGIRHHGPGSARSVAQALASAHMQPDIVLVEGPPDADNALLALAAHADMQPPVALLVYQPVQPQRAVYYPFTVFSPEWQALQYALQQHIPFRFIDLPQAHWMALRESVDAQKAGATPAAENDPLALLAQAAGFSDSERWWDALVESRRDSSGLFQAVLELMHVARADSEQTHAPSRETLLREAHMRQCIRIAQGEGYQRIVVVCGAWHAPALADSAHTPSDDASLLAALPRVDVAATWVPWTYRRLAADSGYGAGVDSPGYYHHLWLNPDHRAARWIARVAHLLREQDLDASPANVLEAVRLADSLSALRGSPAPGLPELNEAVQAVLCHGNNAPMQLIHDQLIVGDALGHVPADTPALPLQQDIEREQKRLRLLPSATPRTLDLDLREATALARSHLLHRLALLDIAWGQPQAASGAKGTFHEIWQLAWEPELVIAVIEASVWGNTVLDAAIAKSRAAAEEAQQLPALTALMEYVLLADLPTAIEAVMQRVQNVAAVTSDIPLLMDALPPLANILRYGNVRQTDTRMIAQVVHGLVTRICVGLPTACSALNDDAAREMDARLVSTHAAMALVNANGSADLHALWLQTLTRLADQTGLHGLLRGRSCRLLYDQSAFSAGEVAQRMGLALSPVNEPLQGAAWIEGFLSGSGLLLLHNRALWRILDEWVVALPAALFTQLLPLLRRTFSTFPAPERRAMGERAKEEISDSRLEIRDEEMIDAERAAQVLPMLAQLLGLRLQEGDDTSDTRATR